MEAAKPVGLGSPKSFLSCKPDSLQVQDINVFKIETSIFSWTSGCILFVFALCHRNPRCGDPEVPSTCEVV